MKNVSNAPDKPATSPACSATPLARPGTPDDRGINSPDPALDHSLPAHLLANTPATRQSQSPLDAHGHDPDAYKWIPVLRRPRKDGWTPARQIDFIAALADCGVVDEAARSVGMSIMSCYRLRRAPGAGNFAAAWEAAIQQSSKRLLDLAFDRAINGSNEPVYDKEGRRVGRRMKTNDRLLMFLLRAYMPERFAGVADPNQHARLLAHEPPLALAPVSDALARLQPVAPDEPLAQLDVDPALAFDLADLLGGTVPRCHLGRPDFPPPSDHDDDTPEARDGGQFGNFDDGLQ